MPRPRLCFICESDLSRRHLNLAFCSDASEEGCALLETSAARGELLRCTGSKERWRFVPVHVADSSFDASGCTGAAARDHTLVPKFFEWFNQEVFNIEPDAAAARANRSARRLRRAEHEERVYSERVGLVPPIEAGWVDPMRWRRVVAGCWAKPAAIHNKEARAALLGLCRAAWQPKNYRGILLSLGDSLSEILAFDRGRAKDRELLSLCRRAAAIQCGTGTRWHRRYVETERNPADKDSRLTASSRPAGGSTGATACCRSRWSPQFPAAGCRRTSRRAPRRLLPAARSSGALKRVSAPVARPRARSCPGALRCLGAGGRALGAEVPRRAEKGLGAGGPAPGAELPRRAEKGLGAGGPAPGAELPFEPAADMHWFPPLEPRGDGGSPPVDERFAPTPAKTRPAKVRGRRVVERPAAPAATGRRPQRRNPATLPNPPPGPAFLELFVGCAHLSGATRVAGIRIAVPYLF